MTLLRKEGTASASKKVPAIPSSRNHHPILPKGTVSIMTKQRKLAVTCMLFAVISATSTFGGMHIMAAGFAIAAGIAGLFAGWSGR